MNNELIIGYTRLKISLPIFIAYEKNLFKKYGLNIKLKHYDTAQLLMDDLVNFKIDMGGYSALPIAFSAMQKTKLLFIGGIYESDEYPISFLLIKKNNHKIKSLKDLKNKKIGILPTKAYKIWIKTIFKKYELDLDESNIVLVEPKDQEQFLDDHTIDALFTNDPMASDIIRKEIGVRLSNEALVPKATGIQPFYFGSFNVTNVFADSNKDVIRKVTRALNDAIVIIGKNKHVVSKSLKKYLPVRYNDTIDFFEKTNFKTSKNITNNDLEKMKLYYYQQNLFMENINIENLQYKYTNHSYVFVSFMRNKFLPFLDENWKLFSLIAILGGWVWSTKHEYDTNFEKANEYQKGLAESRRSQQAQFRLEYGTVDTFSEPIQLINIGRSALKNVRVQMEIYFISNTYKLYAASNLEYIARLDQNLLDKFKKENIINEPNDFEGWFDTKRIYTLSALEGNLFENRSNRNKMDLDLGSFSQVNAIKLNKILNMQIVIRLKIKYNEEISGKLRRTNKYIWFDQNNNQIMRKDLEDIYGGKKLIRVIKEYEDNTKNIIFRNDITKF